MTAEVSMTRRDAYLFVHVQGEPLTPEERQSTLTRMLDEVAESDLDIVVQEETCGVQPPTAWQYISRANFLGTSDFSQRIAYVPPKQMPPDKREFIVNAARNEGLEIRVFSRVEDAIKWIENREDKTS
jgi:hypothetical protein